MGPWENYQSPAAAPPAEGPWTRYQSAPVAAPRQQPRAQVQAAPPAQAPDTAWSDPAPSDQWPEDGSNPNDLRSIMRPEFAAMQAQQQQPKGEPGSSQDNPIDLTGQLYAADVERLRNQTGLWVNTGDRVFRTTGNAYNDNPRPSDQQVGARTYVRDPNNLQDNASAFMSAATEQIPFGDEAVAAGVMGLTGRGWTDTRNQQMDQRALANQGNRGARIAGGVAGFAGSMLAPGGAGFIGKGVNIADRGRRAAAVGAGFGALYGAGSEGNLQERAQAAGIQGAMGAVAGRVLQPASEAALGAARRAATNLSPQRALARQGVQLTPGQMMGGSAQRIEDALTSTPLLGDAIRDAQRRGIESFNSAALNQALSPIGARVGSGRAAIGQADDAVSAAYRSALDGVQVPRDSAFDAQITAIARNNPLPQGLQSSFDGLITDALNRLGQGMDGQAYKQLDSELAASIRAAQSGSQTSPELRLLATKLQDFRQAYRGLIERADPLVADSLRKADEAAAGMHRIRDAAQSQGTSARDGLFTAGDLNRAVRNGDTSAGNRQFARGEAMMQGTSDAAMQVLPSTVPDSGTPFRSAFSTVPALSTLGTGAVNPAIPAAAWAGLFGASRLYGPGVQNVINRAYNASSPGAAQAALGELQALAARSPVLQPLFEAVRSALLPRPGGGRQ